MEYPEQTAEQKAGLAIRIRSNGESLTKLVMMFGVRVQAMLEVRRRFQKQGFDRPVLDESADREVRNVSDSVSVRGVSFLPSFI